MFSPKILKSLKVLSGMKILEWIIERYYKITNTVGTALVAWLLSAIVAHMVSFFISSPSPKLSMIAPSNASVNFDINQPKDISFYLPICTRNIFDSAKQASCEDPAKLREPEVTENQIDPDAAPVKSSLNAKLLGTMVSNIPSFSVATIQENGSKESKNLRVDDTISGEAKIYQIERNRVYFTNNGRKEYLEVDKLPSIFKSGATPVASNQNPSSQGIKIDGGNIKISRQKLDSTLQDLNQLLQQARMVPNYEGGQVDGFKIFGIRGGSIFQELGLQNGDVINRINGTTIDSLEKALPMLQLLKTEPNYTIDINRKGQKQTMNIDIQ